MALDRDKMPDSLRKKVNAEIARQDRCAPPYVGKKAPVDDKKRARNKYSNSKCYCEILKQKFDSHWERTVARCPMVCASA